MTDQDFEQLATDLRTLPIAERVGHMLEHVRHELDKARSTHEWDNVTGLSGMLGRHTEILTAAIGAPDGKAVSEKPKRAT